MKQKMEYIQEQKFKQDHKYVGQEARAEFLI